MSYLINLKIFWFFILLTFLGFILKNHFSSFNFIYSLVIFVVLLFNKSFIDVFIRNKQLVLTTSWIIFTSALILLFTQSSMLYFFVELINFLLVYFILFLIIKTEIKLVVQNYISKYLIFYIFSYFLIYFFFGHNFVDDSEGRYSGLLGSTNLSASLICLSLFFLWEYTKCTKKSFIYLVMCFALWLFLFYITKSRTLFFALPYWLYQFYNYSEKSNKLIKFLMFCVMILIISVVSYTVFFDIDLYSTLRLNEEASLNTRSAIYEGLWIKIQESFYVIPNGFNDSASFVHRLSGIRGYAVHNDFLKYWNDLGVFFIIYIFILGLMLRKYLLNLDLLLIFVFGFSFSFHNIFFSPIIWILSFFLIKLVIYNEPKHKRNSQ